MAYENVDLTIKDTTPTASPIAGVLVRVFSQDGRIFYTQTTTDSLGHAGFMLPSALNYQIRFFKQHTAFENPKYIAVLASPAINIFDITAEIVTPPVSQDPRLCVAYGYFRTPDGAPAEGVDLHFIAKFRPLLLDNDAVLVERVITRTDCNGYAQVNLIRCGKYDVTAQGQEDYQRCISVPNAPNVNLPSLLFPVVNTITFSPVGPIALTVGAELQVTPTVIASDGNILIGGAMEEVAWSTSDAAIVGLNLAGGVLTLRGNAVGTATINAVRLNNTIIRIPDTAIVGVPLTVTVS